MGLAFFIRISVGIVLTQNVNDFNGSVFPIVIKNENILFPNSGGFGVQSVTILIVFG